MSNFDKWESLKEQVKGAVDEGYGLGLHLDFLSTDGGKFMAYRYVLDVMNRLEEEDND